MSNQHTPQSINSSIIYTPIPLKLSFSASRSSKQEFKNTIRQKNRRASTPTHSPSPRKIWLSKFESEYIERPNNAMTRDEKFKELQSLLSPFDSETFIKEIELLD